MRIHDITVSVTPGMPVWPGDPAVERTLVWQIGADSAANVSRLTMSVHTGTHVDAPIHFIANGMSIDGLALETMVGPCNVCEVDATGWTITATDLEALNLPLTVQRLLLKTSNSGLWAKGGATFERSYVSLSASAARWIVDRGIRLVGIDYLSVEPFDAAEPVVHRTLLAGGVIPLEGVDLSGVAAGEYTLVCLPLKLAGSDGAPARVVLIEP